MKQVVVLSGKGGTGKTTFAALLGLRRPGIAVDADVDASNLHLLLHPIEENHGDFLGSRMPHRVVERCTGCGRCRDVCRFDAIDDRFDINEFACEGCGACVTACPEDAISMTNHVSGRWMTGCMPEAWFSGGSLLPGEETSGKLVSLVKENGKELSTSKRADWITVDGSPGIGCPVIASTTGVDAVVLIAEPSVSGLSDLERVLGVVRHFRLPAYLIINKADLSDALCLQIEAFARDNALEILGRVPFDARIPEALSRGNLDVAGPGVDAMHRAIDHLLELMEDVGPKETSEP